MTTRAITVTLTEFSNAPIAGATVMIQLVGLGLSDGGSVAPSQHTAVTDASGICVFNLWPNTEGFEFTHYEIYSTHPITHRLIHNYEPFMVGLVNADVEDLIASFGRDRIAYLRNKISGGTSAPPATTGPHTHNYTEVTAVPSARLLGRYSADAGAAQAITLGDNLTLSPSGVLSAAGGGGSLVKWTVAFETERLAITGLTTDDLHKVCFQSDIVAYFMLSSLSPITWVELNHSSVIDVTQAPFFATGSTEDNQIDELAKIQSAIDYAEANFTLNRKVLIPSGKKFFIDSPVILPSRMHLVVDGELLLRNTAPTPPSGVVLGPYLSGPSDTSRLDDAVLEGSGKIGLSLAASQDPVYAAAEIQPFHFTAGKNVIVKDFTIYRMNFLGFIAASILGSELSHFKKNWCDQVYIENLKLKDPISDTGRLTVKQLNSGRIKDNVFVDNNLPTPMYTGAIYVNSYDVYTSNGLPGSSSITEYVNEMPENWAAHGRIEVSGNVAMSSSQPYGQRSMGVFCNNADVFNNTTYEIMSSAVSERNTTRVHNNFCRGDTPIDFVDCAEYGISVVENNTIEHCSVYGLKIGGLYKFPVTRNNFVLHKLSGEAAQVLNVQQLSGTPNQIKHGQIYDNFYEKEGHANVYGGNSPASITKAKIEMPKWAGSTT
jgi:hypothetical protein